jgi:hypothetical protein
MLRENIQREEKENLKYDTIKQKRELRFCTKI